MSCNGTVTLFTLFNKKCLFCSYNQKNWSIVGNINKIKYHFQQKKRLKEKNKFYKNYKTKLRKVLS